MLALAEQRFPGGVAVPRADDPAAAVAETKRLLREEAPIIYGAAFLHDGFLATIDILLQQRGRWFAYLLRPSTRIKEHQLVDAALHDAVLRGAGLAVDEWCLLLLNPQYVRQGHLSPEELFSETRVAKRLKPMAGQVRPRMQMLKRMAARDRARSAAGEAPYQRPSGGRGSEVPLPSGPLELIVDKPALRAFLEGLQYPLYFMDFESYQEAIPEWDGHWPFRQLPFGYSVHRIEAPGAEPQHEAFVAPTNREPTASFGEALLRATGNSGTVLVYNRDSEQLTLEQLKSDHPRWQEAITALTARLVDLMLPFSQKLVEIPGIGNKLSLKYVLPALVPDMSYALLAIGSGDHANQAYNALRASSDPEFIDATRKDLLEYCELDTLAMVRILERLYELAKEG
ncbi:hypothetical protein GCM10023184_03110 [Flaviaesturariibacter amylovorans]|uniref:DUF2779 domain-containing protein n=1 Tax=Flaviaesturariibacter amylovorans TaxID=1084520 RepID=A0ABP8G719_9BACT